MSTNDPAALQRLANQVQRGICPRGVYRFKTHEEADEWMLKMMVRAAAKS